MQRLDIDSWEIIVLPGMRYKKSDIRAVHLADQIYVYGICENFDQHPFEKYTILLLKRKYVIN